MLDEWTNTNTTLLKILKGKWYISIGNDKIMGESFQDYSWVQDFEADFPQKVSLKILN